MISLLRRLFQRASKVPLGIVSIERDSIRYAQDLHSDQTINREGISRIDILTTDLGPFQEDLFYLLYCEGSEPECIIPQGAEGTSALLQYILSFPGYNDQKVIEAMGSTENARFTIWTREAEQGAAANP